MGFLSRNVQSGISEKRRNDVCGKSQGKKSSQEQRILGWMLLTQRTFKALSKKIQFALHVYYLVPLYRKVGKRDRGKMEAI